MSKNFTLWHEREALRRYLRTHHWNSRYPPVDLTFWESEMKQLNSLINCDPLQPSYSQYLLIQDRHRFWRGKMF